MSLYADRVKDSTTTVGTGSITLSGTAPTGYQSFGTAFGSTPLTVAYCIADQNGPNWEVGTGVFNGTTGLTRVTVLASSGGGALVAFTAGTKDVFCTAPAKYLDPFTSTNQGTVPASGGGTTKYLRADGTFEVPPDTITTPAGSTTQVQFNNAGVFGASSNFTYNTGTNTVSFGNITGSALAMTIQPKAPTGVEVAGALVLAARNAVPGGTGGLISLTSGDGNSAGYGGAMTFTAGTGYAGGSMTFTAGAATGAAAGAVGGSMSFTAGNSSSAANAGDLTFIAGSSGAGSFSGFRGGNLTFSSGSSDLGPAGSFTCATGIGATDSGSVTFETGFASGGTSGNINLITGDGGNSTAGNAGNLVYTGGAAGNDVDDFSGTGGGLVFTGGFGYGSAGIGGSFTFTAGGGNAAQGSISFATVSGTTIQLADSGGARQLGLFGTTPVAQPTTSTTAATRVAVVGTLANIGDTYDGYTLAKVVKALRNLGILA